MVLEMKVPHGVTDFKGLLPIFPVFLSYVLSFLYIGIYWNNHHHLMQAISHVSGAVLWANLHLLYWLSLVPFVTGWMGENNFEKGPTALYGFVLLMAALSYYMLQTVALRREGPDSVLAKALGSDLKGKISPVLYIIGIPAALYHPWIASAIYGVVALIWLIPDRRIEMALGEES